MTKFKGIYPALVTPFDENGNINAKALEKLTDKLQKKGVNGFYLSGSTGESYLMSMAERKRLLEIVHGVTGSNIDLIVNVGMFYTEHSIELAKHAEKYGVSAISAVPPFYFPFNQEEYSQYYEDVANAVDVPMIIYNIPAMSSVKFTTDTLLKFLEDGKIVGIKHTSYDLFQLQQLIQRYPEKSLFIGHDEIFLSALAVGAEAGIGSTYNIMVEKFIEIMSLYQLNRMNQALKIQGEVNSVVEVLCKVGVFKGIKEILRMQGIECGNCRRPFLPLTKSQKDELKVVAEQAHII